MARPSTTTPIDSVVLRMARADDDRDLGRLAELDTALPLPGPALVAVENGAIVAAVCLSTGRAIANPFVPSLHLVELLRRHAGSHQAVADARPPRPLPRLVPRARGA
jgi:hypothetical protein